MMNHHQDGIITQATMPNVHLSSFNGIPMSGWGLGELGITSLVGSSASSARWLIGLVGFTIRLSLATALIAAKTIL